MPFTTHDAHEPRLQVVVLKKKKKKTKKKKAPFNEVADISHFSMLKNAPFSFNLGRAITC